jgi:type I restriction enzyme, S subunit
MVRVTDVKGGFLNLSETLTVTKEVFEEFTRRHIPQTGDIVFSRVGTYGNSSFVGSETLFCLGQNTALIHPRIDARFLHFCLQSPSVRQQIEQSAVGSTQKTISLKSIGALQVPVPPQRELQAITHILGSLDDKIELNRRMNETLEAIARALFKSWFVDFDPVRAKAEGRDTGLPKHLADLFPNSFEDSALGEIPKGWRVGSVDEELLLTMGQSPPGETYNELGDGLPFYQGSADFTFRFPARRVFCTAPTRYANAGDTLVSVRAPVGDINMAAEDCAIGRGVAAVRHKTGARSYTYLTMHHLESVFDQFEAEGTVFGSIGKKDFHAIPVIGAPDALVQAFEQMVAPLDDRIDTNEHQIQTLTGLRDALLPKLISGELRVGDAERFVQEAAS